MAILAQHLTRINIPADRDAYRAWVESLDQRAYALVFGVPPGATMFRCPTTGRAYVDRRPVVMNDAIWTRCACCDAALHVRGDAEYDAESPQRHCYPIVEVADA